MNPPRLRSLLSPTDQLLLGGEVLDALDTRCMPLDAKGYRSTAVWMMDVLGALDNEILRRLRECGPGPIRVLAENELSDRGDCHWGSDTAASAVAAIEWPRLVRRLGR
jgi:hypothetical protein